MTDTEALKQALEALESCNTWHITDGSRQWYDERLVDKAITAIKEALAQPQQEPVAWITHNAGLYHFKPDQSLDPLPLFLAQPPCPTCEALARTVMMDQTGRDV